MKLQIADTKIRQRFERMLERGGDLYSFDDIVEAIECGNMQSHVHKGTWIITQVLDYPRKRVLEVAFVVGDLAHAVQFHPQLLAFAQEHRCAMVRAYARSGWDAVMLPGWRRHLNVYMKDL